MINILITRNKQELRMVHGNLIWEFQKILV